MIPDDGPFLDLNVFASHGNVNWDARIYTGDPIFSGLPGPYYYGAFSTSVIGDAAQYSYRWWDRDFGGGLYDITLVHVTGFDVAIYSVRIDGLEVARLDGYSLIDVNNIQARVARVPIAPGPHRISIHMDSTSPLTTGLPWYPAIQGMYFSKVGPYQAPLGGMPKGKRPRLFGRTVDICPIFASGNTNWDSFQITNAMWYTFELYSSGAQNAARWWDLSLDAGLWDLEIRCATFSSAGIITVQIDGVSVGTIDTYSATTTYGVRKTLSGLPVTQPGTHRLTFLMATKNASSSQYYGDISGVQLRQQPTRQVAPLYPVFAWRPMFGCTGQSGWPDSGTINGGTRIFNGEPQSAGAINGARWWDLNLAAGTYAFDLVHSTATNRGIYSIGVDGVTKGTIDGYAGFSENVRSSATGIVIPSNGVHRISLTMATKNASSSAYYGAATLFALRRT